MFVMEYRRDGKCPIAATHDPALAEVLRLLFHKKHSPCADQQKRAENVENKIESIDELDPEPNHQAAHHQRADDSPHQSAMLCHRRDSGGCGKHNINETVGKDMREVAIAACRN